MAMEQAMGERDAIDRGRRGALKCMAWAGTGLVWTVAGGVPAGLGLEAAARTRRAGAFSFVQISDSHIGFAKAANPDAGATFRQAVARIAALPQKPDFILHTGDVSQLSRDEQFDEADQVLKATGLPVFYTPGEHDVLDDGAGAAFLARFGKGTTGRGWQSFDHAGVHFVGLVNVLDLRAGGGGSLGADQIAWLGDDLAGRPSSTPIVVFAHIPLWPVYAPWGWTTDDALQALALLRRFGSVTVLNGHIHQVQQTVEGRISFQTARSTAFPQAAPGAPGASPGPMTVPPDQLPGVLGLREATFGRHGHAPIIADQTLAS
jgi:hypothetical protein